jgi:hypothetical protein
MQTKAKLLLLNPFIFLTFLSIWSQSHAHVFQPKILDISVPIMTYLPILRTIFQFFTIKSPMIKMAHFIENTFYKMFLTFVYLSKITLNVAVGKFANDCDVKWQARWWQVGLNRPVGMNRPAPPQI